MNNLKNIKKLNKLNKNVIVLGLGLALSACGGSDDNPADVIEDILNTAPTINSTAVTTVESGTAYSYSLAATDADGDMLTMSAANLPAWLTFDSATGSLSGTPAESDAGDTAITLTVSDGTEDIMQSFTVSVTVPAPVNNAAVITSTGVTSATVGEAYSYTLTATDADADTLTMSATIPGALSWLTFDATTGILSGTPASGDAVATPITLTVNDGTEDRVQTFTITVVAAVVDPVADAPRDAAEASFIVSDNMNNWGSWIDPNGSSQVITDPNPDYDMVNEITITANNFVAGYEPTVDGTPIDVSAFASTGTFEFDLKVTTAPAGTEEWFIKIEGTDGTLNDYSIFNDNGDHSAIEVGVWQHYSFNISDLTGLDLTAIDNVMLFPNWASNGGAVYQLDNFAFYPDGAVAPDETRLPGDSGDGATTTTAVAIDFEGPQLTWGSFDTAKVQYVANPDNTGINTSATVALLDILQDDGEWAGARTEGIDTFALDATNCTVKLDVYKNTIGTVHVKFEKQNGDGWGSAGTVTAVNTVVNEWETLTFDTCDWIGHAETGVIDGFAIHADQTGSRSQDTLNYFDNIMFSVQEVTETTGPTNGAPVPTQAAADVISVFSDTYTAVAEVDTNPNWDQLTVTTVEVIDGNNTLKMAGLNYQGIQFATQDVSGKTSLHLDYWTEDATTFDVYLISSGAETSYTVTTTQSGWQSVDIPLSTYTANGDLTQAFQFKFVGSGTVYLDNMMFTDTDDVVVPPVEPTTAAPTPTEAAADVISVFSDTYTAVAEVDTNPNWDQLTVTTVEVIDGNNTLKMAGLNYQGIQFATQDVSGKTSLHLDYWTEDATTFDVYLISSGTESLYTVTTTQSGWQSVDIPLSTYTANGDLTQAFQFKFVGSGTVYLDNLYFNSALD
jgi:hypothetical protein